MKIARILAGAMALALLPAAPAPVAAQTFALTTIAADAGIVFRDWCTAGVPTSCAGSTLAKPVPYNPAKSDIRKLFGAVGGAITQLASTGAAGALAYQTRAAMNADLAHAANTLASVWLDSTATNNGFYIKSGASGSGSWVQASTSLLGLQPSWTVGSVTTVDCGTSAAVAISGTPSAPVLDYTIPRGCSGINPRGEWSSGTTYAISDVVHLASTGASYIAIAAGANHDPSATGSSYWSILASGLGYTALNSASNLSDVANATTARANIGANNASNINAGSLDLARLAVIANNSVLCNLSGAIGVPSACDLTTVSIGSAYNVKDPRFGAIGDDSADDAPAFAAAYAAACAQGGGLVFAPTGTYKWSESVVPTCNNVHLAGVGKGSAIPGYNGGSVIAVAFNTSTAISLGTSSVPYKGMTIRDITFATQAGYGRTAEPYVKIWGAEITLENVAFTNCWHCIAVENNGGQAGVEIRNVGIQVCGGAGILYGHEGSNVTNEVTVTNLRTGSCQVAEQFEYSDGIYHFGVSAYQSYNAWKFMPRSSGGMNLNTTNTECHDCALDSSTSSAIVVVNTGGITGNIALTGGSCNSNGGSCLDIASGATFYGWAANGTRFENNTARAATILSGKFFTFTGASFGYNSQAGSGSYSDIYIKNASNLNITGGQCGANGNLYVVYGGSAKTAYCLQIDTGVSNVQVAGVSSHGHTVNDWTGSPTGSNIPANGTWY